MPNRSKNIDLSIGERIKHLRTAKNITQKEFAEQLYKSESTVRMWELGKSEPDLEMLKTIAVFFGVTIDFLLGRERTVPSEAELKTALFGSSTVVTDEMWSRVVDYAELIKVQYEQEIKEKKKNMQIAARLRLAMKKTDIFTFELSRATKIEPLSIAAYIDAREIPNDKDAKILAQTLGVVEEWLICKDNSMPLKEALQKTESGISDEKWKELIEYARIIGIEPIDSDDIFDDETPLDDEDETFDAIYRAARSQTQYDDQMTPERLKKLQNAPESDQDLK